MLPDISQPPITRALTRYVTNWPEYPLVSFLMLTLVSASKSDNPDSFAVFDGENCVGHVVRTQKSPPGKPWFWTIFVSSTYSGTADRGYAVTRDQAMAELEASVASSKNLRTELCPL